MDTVSEKHLLSLAQLNRRPIMAIKHNWEQKRKEFQQRTKEQGFNIDIGLFASDEPFPLAVFTRSGSIFIISQPDHKKQRIINYFSIPKRSDDSKSVPAVFKTAIKQHVILDDSIHFQNGIVTSRVMYMKTSEIEDDPAESRTVTLSGQLSKHFKTLDEELLKQQINYINSLNTEELKDQYG
ncbi:MAG: hypothetical protein MJB14_13420 [Spirochaetes bacterium]|nr:hypothetical protein [Spirochaetota bacterium]